MFELFKLLSDLLVLGDAKRKGTFSWKAIFLGFGFSIFLYSTALPAFLLYQNHPQYKWLLITTLVIDAVSLIFVLILGTRWQREAKARAAAQISAQKSPATPERMPCG